MHWLRRYGQTYWDSLGLLISVAIIALFIPSIPTALSVVVISLLIVGCMHSLNQQSSAIVRHLSQLFPRQTTASQLYNATLSRRIKRLQRQSQLTAALLTIAILITAWLAGLQSTDTLNFIETGIAASLPLGLLLTLRTLTARGTKYTAAAITNALRITSSNNLTQVILLTVGVVGFLGFHIPLALTCLEILLINALLGTLPITGLSSDTSTAYMSAQARREALLFSLLAALLVYANFLLFFARHHVSPVRLDTTNFLYGEASSLSILSLLGCQYVQLLLIRAHHQQQFFTDHLLQNLRLHRNFVCSLLVAVVIFYVPGIKQFFGAGPLTIVDWLSALATTMIYLGFRLIQRHTRQHTRHAVLYLHQQLRATKQTSFRQ